MRSLEIKKQKFMYGLTSWGILSVLGLAAIAASPFAYAIDLKLKKECVLPDGTINPHCDQQKLLREGSDVQNLYAIQLDAKIRLVESEGTKDPNKINDYQQDGTCLPVGPTLPSGESLTECIARLKRQLLDVRLETRERTLKYNNSRREMIDQKGKLQATEPKERNGEPKPPKPTAVLKDLYDASRPPDPNKKVQAKQLPPALKGRIGPASDVSFGTRFSDPNSLNLKKSEKIKAADINDEVKLDVSGKDSAIDIEGKSDETQLSAKLKGQEKALAKKYQEDNNKMKKSGPANPNAANDPHSTSSKALTAVMDSIEDQSIEKKFGKGKLPPYAPKRGTGEALDDIHLDSPISDDPKAGPRKPGDDDYRTQDENISDTLDAVKNSL